MIKPLVVENKLLFVEINPFEIEPLVVDIELLIVLMVMIVEDIEFVVCQRMSAVRTWTVYLFGLQGFA